MKKLILILLGLAGATLAAQAQSAGVAIQMPLPGGPVLVGGAAPVYMPVVYDQGATYNAPVQYYAPVQYNAPVYYNTTPFAPAVCPWVRPCCANSCGSSVQVIPFGRGQARQQGYSFTAAR